MTQFQDATRCLLGWPKRAAGCFYQSLVHLVAFVSIFALACTFLIGFLLFPITLPLMYWLMVKSERTDEQRRKVAEELRDLRLNCLSPIIKQPHNDKRG